MAGGIGVAMGGIAQARSDLREIFRSGKAINIQQHALAMRCLDQAADWLKQAGQAAVAGGFQLSDASDDVQFSDPESAVVDLRSRHGVGFFRDGALQFADSSVQKLSKIEINGMIAEAIEFLRKSQPGRPSSERQENRRKANEILSKLTIAQMKTANSELVDLLGMYA